MSQKHPPRYTFYSICIIDFVLLWFVGELQVTLPAVLQANYFLSDTVNTIKAEHLSHAIKKSPSPLYRSLSTVQFKDIF